MLANELHKKTAPGAALSDFQELHLDAERSCNGTQMSCDWTRGGAASKRRPRSCVSSQRSCISSINGTAANNFSRKVGKTTLNPSHSTRLWAQLKYFYYILNHLPAHKPAHRLYPILLYHIFSHLSNFFSKFPFKFLQISHHPPLILPSIPIPIPPLLL